MNPKPPVIDYARPRSTTRRPINLDLILRGLVGIFAAFIAAVFLVGGLLDGFQSLGWIHLATTVPLTAIAYALLRPVPFITGRGPGPRPQTDSPEAGPPP